MLTVSEEENIMRDPRTRALDSRGRPVAGLYVREGRFIAGFACPQTGRWRMQTLKAETLTEAKKERASVLSALRDRRAAAPDTATFADLFAEYQDSRQLAERTRRHERQLLDRHLAEVARSRAQDVTASELARLLRTMRDTYSPWTCVAVYRILAGTFALGLRRGILTRSPIDGLTPSERPKQKNAKRVAVLSPEKLAQLAAAGGSERWRAAIALAGFAGLRLGEIRALRWRDVDFDAGTLTVRRSALPDGTFKAPKTAAGTRTIPLLPALRRGLAAWRLRSPLTGPDDLVIASAIGSPVQERNLRRVLEEAKARVLEKQEESAAPADPEERLSWHALRHSFASMLATDLSIPATTLARLTGHADAGFTLKVYARDARGDAAIAEDVLSRAATAKVGA